MREMIAILALGLLLLPFSCLNGGPEAELVLGFEWAQPNECSEFSPEIRISGLPETARFLRVRLQDLYQPGADHGGWGQIPCPESHVIPPGGLPHFRGPCPPNTTEGASTNSRSRRWIKTAP